MGCHTWFFKPYNISKDKVRNNVINTYKRSIKFYDNMINHRDKIDLELLETYPEWTIDYGIKQKAIVERQLKIVKKGLCEIAIYNKYHTSNYNVTSYNCKKQIFYISSNDLPHDVFRIGDYPDDILFSLEETLKYLEDNDDNIYYTSTCFDKTDRNILKQEAIKQLVKFWKKYPEGMINFG
jgi:hydroxymethylpyrimidine pyrophosphatase-like HAD family hydrolase